MGRTSIPCSDDTRDQLASQKATDETWDDCLTRLADDTAAVPTNDDKFEMILTELRGIREHVDTDDNDAITINAIREAVRIEIREQLEELRR